MKLEQQVVSLELAKSLKKLGVKQDSLFVWTNYGSNKFEVRIDIFTDKGYRIEQDGVEFYAAFTVAELISLLQTVAEQDIIIALTDKNPAETLGEALCTKLLESKETAGFGHTL